MEHDDILPAIERETGAAPRFSIIWLHGLGADGSDFLPIIPELGLPADCAVRFVFPHAPQRPVTCNGGWIMPAWYDIVSLDRDSRRVDEGGLLRSRDAIGRLIERENERGVPSARIILAGFSQGGAVALTTALTWPERLAGVIGLSTYIPLPDLLDTRATEANRGLPVFAAHGEDDDIVAPELGRAARDWLLANGHAVDWREYPLPHSVSFHEIRDIGGWLRERFAVA